MAYRIYLVEDEANLNQVLTSYLQKAGWEVSSFLSGEEMRPYMDTPADLWILDIMLPDTDGFALLREIKSKYPTTPIVFISARDAELDRVIGLEMGSDDYLPKPFLPRELVIRVKKLLERVYTVRSAGVTDQVREIGPYAIDEQKRMVHDSGDVVDLTSKEFDILLLFLQHQGQAFSREQVLRQVWGDDYFGTDRVVDDLIRRLRKKLPELRIETMYGYGYRMVTG
ncbi:response regulator transcription factor [Paenibacillus eucommiae]|uniref:Two-component system response regulator CssR n=1 Tax=Paenibacillus eucommiae TaxID=1355755 RepID=A0ABS4J5C5_9BACL|nr:response regulator transcription factor [Paenibacillus eucommiae]MBP1995049.1 two-component system response regulator CssR [Paenibacillus eucommiae]